MAPRALGFPYIGHGLGKIKDDFVLALWFQSSPAKATQRAVDGKLDALAGVPRKWRAGQRQLMVWIGDVEFVTMINHNPDIETMSVDTDDAKLFGVKLERLNDKQRRLLAFRSELHRNLVDVAEHDVTCALELHPYTQRFKGTAVHADSMKQIGTFLACFDGSLKKEDPNKTVKSGEMTTHRMFSSFCRQYLDPKWLEGASAEQRSEVLELIDRARPGCRDVPFGRNLDETRALLQG